MHLTRPKSSKGRSRPAVRDTDSSPASPPDTTLRSRSQPVMWPSGRALSRDQVVHMLQHAPAARPPSLNKYKVLPSIERRRSEQVTSLGEDMSKLGLSHPHGAILQEELDRSAREGGGHQGSPAREAGSLLLAIRTPCGRRFQQHFEPTDTLLMVRASAEARYGARYAEASIETMDVPRRSFADMKLTLAQCGILNRSVLCISQTDGSEVDRD